jgi:hypothetical protein
MLDYVLRFPDHLDGLLDKRFMAALVRAQVRAVRRHPPLAVPPRASSPNPGDSPSGHEIKLTLIYRTSWARLPLVHRVCSVDVLCDSSTTVSLTGASVPTGLAEGNDVERDAGIDLGRVTTFCVRFALAISRSSRSARTAPAW